MNGPSTLNTGCDMPLRQVGRGILIFVFAILNHAMAAEYVGRDACADCHTLETEQWTGSHHDLAMEVATEQTVLGDFGDAVFHHRGQATRFFREQDRFMVRTEGPDGEIGDYPIRYTFGVSPLQQYLIELPGGRLQALGIAWDSRRPSQGGQRWFHLYPDDALAPGDPRHWAGNDQNWNYMCAECHSTNLTKNFDETNGTFDTTWSEIDVSCEACHGPGSDHMAWATAGEPASDTKGLSVDLTRTGQWSFRGATNIASRQTSSDGRGEIETCARCHSRRASLWPTYRHGEPFLDTHRPSLLEAGLYHSDGQILDEVYVYGSFLQSRMYHAGVTCADCHNPHSLELKANGNELCAQCHRPELYDRRSHHQHETNTEGSQCVSCHMPATTYMVIDPRRDHSMRIPRPDLSSTLQTPNACNRCHLDQTSEWAANAISRWFPNGRREPHYGEALLAGRQGQIGADKALRDLIENPTTPNIVKGTAATLLAPYRNSHALAAARKLAADSDPLLRWSALQVLADWPVRERVTLALPLINDEVRLVRAEAALQLIDVPRSSLPVETVQSIDRAMDEYLTAQRNNAERAEYLTNIANFYLRSGRPAEAEAKFLVAIRTDPMFAPAYVNLADLYRALGRDPTGERLLRRAIQRIPDTAVLQHSLGLLLIRQGRLNEAVQALRNAAELDEGSSRFLYVYAVALLSSGQTTKALEQMTRAHELRPADTEILQGLVATLIEQGNLERAQHYAGLLVRASPENQQARALLQRLEGVSGDKQ